MSFEAVFAALVAIVTGIMVGRQTHAWVRDIRVQAAVRESERQLEREYQKDMARLDRALGQSTTHCRYCGRLFTSETCTGCGAARSN
jgi:hypothetical protein